MVDCPKCGSSNPAYSAFCGRCGAEIPWSLREADAASAKDTTPLPGPPLDAGAASQGTTGATGWTPGGQGVQPPSRISAASIFRDQRDIRIRFPSATLSIGGMCAIVAGLLAIVQGAIAIISGGTMLIIFPITGGWIALAVIFGIVEIVLGVYSLQGGVCARELRRYPRALIGAILGMVAFGFVIGGFLGLVAVILIALCRDEFRK